MKTIKIIMVALLVMQTFVSCKKDEKPEDKPQPAPKEKKEMPIPEEEGIYQGDKRIFKGEFKAVQGNGIGTSIIFSESQDNPYENYLKITLPKELQEKSLGEIKSIKLKGNLKITLNSVGKTPFSEEQELTVTNIRTKESLVGISAEDKDKKEYLFVFLVLDI